MAIKYDTSSLNELLASGPTLHGGIALTKTRNYVVSMQENSIYARKIAHRVADVNYTESFKVMHLRITEKPTTRGCTITLALGLYLN